VIPSEPTGVPGGSCVLGNEEGNVAVAGDGVLQHSGFLDINAVPTPECLGSHLGPERTSQESRPATAEAILCQCLRPQVAELADCDEPWEFAQQPVEQRAPAPSRAPDQQHGGRRRFAQGMDPPPTRYPYAASNGDVRPVTSRRSRADMWRRQS